MTTTATEAPTIQPQGALVHVGIDVGSTTVKSCVIDPVSNQVLHSRYWRHHARQAESAADALREAAKLFPESRMRVAVCGSGGEAIAQALGVPYVQEVVANAIAVRRLHPQARCAIELGGQDAKMIFFRTEENGATGVADMRMNGSCAGGTGAFIDEIAALLKVPVERFDALAAQGTTVYEISGRCGVYAKTDIQPLLNQGASKADLALSAFHAIAKQTLGGLAQGLDVVPPVIFEGGPFTFNPTLVRVFCERLQLEGDQAIRPEHPETIVALGTAFALDELFADEAADLPCDFTERLRADDVRSGASLGSAAAPLFASEAELAAFRARHAAAPKPPGPAAAGPGQTLRVYLGIDSGSTTTKFALIDEDENLIDQFYAANEGQPLDVARDAFLALRERYRAAGVTPEIAACGTTGYGEQLFARAFHADYHTVETVAHAAAATKHVPDATFILDIGGQDMKAIWLDGGVITDIMVNEACSSGCGSFLEGFASSLGIPVEGIADAALRSKSPAVLGSRCTVFMNSSIVSEQRRGKNADDIMAGLARSIIENVFTKVIRIANTDALGDRIVVQGGTFKNDAVLRALELYLGREVTRAPYPGVMGAIGAALIAKRRMADAQAGGALPAASSFIGLDAMEAFSYTREANVPCPFCSNHCARSLVTFSDGSSYVTGNRCERGEVVGDPRDENVRRQLRASSRTTSKAPDLFAYRQKLLFEEGNVEPLAPERGITIGLPCVLALWDNLPFWRTLLRSLGFDVRVSGPSTHKLYERGLPAVASDTVCFPAKLVHGHLRDLADAKVDRIFMPIITTVPTENAQETSQWMCAVVKGYPLVVCNSDNPERRWGIPFDAPLFHWYTRADRDRQLPAYLNEAFGIGEDLAQRAIQAADAAQARFRQRLRERGRQVIEEAQRTGTYAIVLASRPYHNDPLVNHDLPHLLRDLGHAVLPPDAVPGADEVDLSRSRLDIVNNFHARMLGCALIAATDPALEYVQLVSFGCGHDAYLSDEIARLMHEASGGSKTPLVVKMDESDAAGPVRIRVRSFIETVDERRKAGRRASASDSLPTPAPQPAPDAKDASPAAPSEGESASAPSRIELPDPYPAKYTRRDRHEKVVLVPNTSHAFARLMTATFCRQGMRAVALDVGGEEAIRLGKKYVHNDICFPAQMTIGEALAALTSGEYDDAQVAIGTGKYIGDCRLTHYSALLRKALDDAGYAHVPIITNDDVDAHGMHPGFKMSTAAAIRTAVGLPMIDALEALLRRMRPYELEPGSANAAFDRALDAVMDGLERHGVRGAASGFRRAIGIMGQVRYDRSRPRPTVLIVGEYLLNFHPGANRHVEDYLERNGMEVIEARMTDVIRKTYFYKNAQVKEYGVDIPRAEAAWYAIADKAFDLAHSLTDRIGRAHPLYEAPCRMPELVKASDPIIHHTFDAGEGVLIPAEILHHAAKGCRAFVILQPFGCLPNHVVGRGIAKRLKELYPTVQILPLDYDPDVSFANIENRLQMLIMNARASETERSAAQDGNGPAQTAPSHGDADGGPRRTIDACLRDDAREPGNDGGGSGEGEGDGSSPHPDAHPQHDEPSHGPDARHERKRRRSRNIAAMTGGMQNA